MLLELRSLEKQRERWGSALGQPRPEQSQGKTERERQRAEGELQAERQWWDWTRLQAAVRQCLR